MKKQLLSLIGIILSVCLVFSNFGVVGVFADDAVALQSQEAVFFVQYGANGDGLTEQTPGTFATVFDAINESYTTGDTVTIKVVPCANDSVLNYTDISTLGFPSLKDFKEHSATVVLTSLDAANRSHVVFVNQFSMSNTQYIASDVQLKGPTVFENIFLIDPRMDYSGNFYCNGNNLTFGPGVDIRRPYTSNGTYMLHSQRWRGTIGGGARTSRTYNKPFTVFLSNNSFIYTGSITTSGYNTSGVMTFNEDVTFRLGTGTAALLRIDDMNNGAYAHYKKNLNIVLNGTTITTLGIRQENLGPIVNGAVQIIKNNGAKIITNSSVAYTDSTRTANATMYDLTVASDITLDVTEQAGKYSVGGQRLAYAVSADGKTAWYSVGGMLTIDEAGTYSILSAASVDEIKQSLEEPEHTPKLVFDGWLDDGNGKLTANLIPNTDEGIDEYFVKYGGTGDGRTSTSPAGNIKTALQSINDDGWASGENVTVYLMPTGQEPTKQQLDSNGQDGTAPPIKIDEANGFITYNNPSVPHTATVTYTTYNFNPEAQNKMILATGDNISSTNYYTGATHIYLCGPTVFKDLYVIDTRMDNYTYSLYTQNYSIKTQNVDFRRTTGSNYAKGRGYTHIEWGTNLVLGLHASLNYSGSTSASYVADVGHCAFSYVYLVSRGSYSGNSFAYIGNDEERATINNVYPTNTKASTLDGVFNVAFKNITINKFSENSAKIAPTVGAMQIILNNSEIVEKTAVINGPLYILMTENAGTLDFTDNVGEYSFDTQKAYAVAYSNDRKKAYIAQNGQNLIIDSPGEYIVEFINDISEINLEYTSDTSEYTFDKWTMVNGQLKPATRPSGEDTALMYYARYGGTGDGRTPDAPANTVCDAINSINSDVKSGIISAEQEVTVYIMEAEDWRTYNSTWGLTPGSAEYNAVPLVGSTSGRKPHHMTSWRSEIADSTPSYDVVLNVKSYNHVSPAYMPTNQYLGANTRMRVGGKTNFDYINIVDTRYGFRELEIAGNKVTFGKNTTFAAVALGEYEADNRWSGGFFTTSANILVGTYASGSFSKEVQARFYNSFSIVSDDRGLFLGSSVGNAVSYSDNVTVVLDNSDISTSFHWQGKGTGGTVSFEKNLNIVIADAKKIIHRERDGAAVNVCNLQYIVNTDTEYCNSAGTAVEADFIPQNVAISGGKWIIKVNSQTKNVLSPTEAAGTFAVNSDGVVLATNSQSNENIASKNNTLVLPAGTYTIELFTNEQAQQLAANVTLDGQSDSLYFVQTNLVLPRLEDGIVKKFVGWRLNGAEEIYAPGYSFYLENTTDTYAFTSVWANAENTGAIYLDAANGNDQNDGSENSPVATLAKAFELATALTELYKKVAVVGTLSFSGAMPSHTERIYITGVDDSSVFDLNNDIISLNGPVTFENITLKHTTTQAGKILNSNGFDLTLGENVKTDSNYYIRLGAYQTQFFNKQINGAFYSGVFGTLEVGNFWVTNNRANAKGANVLVDGAFIGTLSFCSNTYSTSHLGNTFTEPVRVLINSGRVNKLSVTTQAENATAYTVFDDTVEILSNNSAVASIDNDFAASNGAWIVDAQKADDGTYLEYTDVCGVYNVVGSMTALATDNENGGLFVSTEGVLTLPSGYYSVKFVDKIDYLVNDDAVNFYSTCSNIDLSLIKVPKKENKVFMGWTYENGTAPDYKENSFTAGDKLVASFIDYTPNNGETSDFEIIGAQVRTGGSQLNGLRYVVQMNNGFYNELTRYSASIINPNNPNYGTIVLPTTLTKGRSMFYEKPIVLEWSLVDGKLGSAQEPYALEDIHNATPITTNNRFPTETVPTSVPAVKTFEVVETERGAATRFTVCIVGIKKQKFTEYYSVRGYIRYIDANGFERVFYSDYYQTSIYAISKIAKQSNEQGAFLDEVVGYVDAKPGEGGLYDDYMAQNYETRQLLSGYPTTPDTAPSHAMYMLENGFKIREIDINYSGDHSSDPVEIVQFADVHLNWINEQDLDEAIPSTISTYRGRSWNRDGTSTSSITTAMEYGRLFDQIVITGDVMDYFSWGCAEIMQKLIVDRDKDVLIALGNHEPAEFMQNDANVSSYYNGKANLYPLLQEVWPHDINYTSKIIYNDSNAAKVMCVVLNNEQDIYIEEQGTKLLADIAIAKEMDIPILIFEHDPICTGDLESDPHTYFYAPGDWSWMKWSASNINHAEFPKDSSGNILATKYDPSIHDSMGLVPYKLNNFETYWVNCPETNKNVPADKEWYSQRGAGKPTSDAVTKSVYNIIVTNSDVIRGVFCGHVHDNMQMEIKASYTNQNGEVVEQSIPQYVVTSNAYSKGAAIKIKVW